jgi:hypothetical protein
VDYWAQVLGSIEEREAREREEKKLLTEIALAMPEEHGLDAGTFGVDVGG